MFITYSCDSSDLSFIISLEDKSILLRHFTLGRISFIYFFHQTTSKKIWWSYKIIKLVMTGLKDVGVANWVCTFMCVLYISFSRGVFAVWNLYWNIELLSNCVIEYLVPQVMSYLTKRNSYNFYKYFSCTIFTALSWCIFFKLIVLIQLIMNLSINQIVTDILFSYN